jgi:hypothetical protein
MTVVSMLRFGLIGAIFAIFRNSHPGGAGNEFELP